MVIIGPCSIHDPAAALEYARRLKVAREQYKKDYYSLVHGRNGSLISEAQNALRKGGVEDMEGLFTDWRRRKRLSVNEEATMRVAIAEKEQEDAARAAVESRDYLAKIEAYIAQIVAEEE